MSGKYVFSEGVMTLRPDLTTMVSEKQLAIVSSLEDVEAASITQTEAVGSSVSVPEGTISAIEAMRSEDYAAMFDIEGSVDLFEEMSLYFAKYNIPLGLLVKLLVLKNYRINIIVDDSGSMSQRSDVTYGYATEYVSSRKRRNEMAMYMSRWEEAEDRLHLMADLLAFIPTKNIQISFMNSPHIINLAQKGHTPSAFQQLAHSIISETFASIVISESESAPSLLTGTVLSSGLGKTPTLHVLQRAFEDSESFEDPTAHYLLTDGVPSDSSISQVEQLVCDRKNPEKNPLTFLSCSNDDKLCAWMKEIEKRAPYTAEIDDFFDELSEVIRRQGRAFPYTRGMWVVSNLAAAVNPNDMDAIDDDLPFSKFTLDELMGRTHCESEYAYYFNNHPQTSRYSEFYNQFLNESCHARNFLPTEFLETNAKKACTIM